MLTQDASAALPHDKRQIFDCLVAEARQILRDRQQADLTTARAKKPKGDRMRAGEV